jgi:hypothetical protein
MPGLGCKIDDRRKCGAQKPAQELLRTLGAQGTPKGKASLTQFATPRMDQGESEGCTAHATSNGLWIVHAAAGRPLLWVPSQNGIWAGTLSAERTPDPSGSLPALPNAGCQSVDVMFTIGNTGIWEMEGAQQQDGRFSDVNTNPREVTFDQGPKGALTLSTGQYRIDETDPNWPVLAAICLDNNIPVYVGRCTGPNYRNWKPSMGPLNTPDTGGGHATLLTGYSKASNGDLIFEDIGSWGTSFADDGIWGITGDCLYQVTFDVYPLSVMGVSHGNA